MPFALALAFRWHRAIRLVCLPLLFSGTLIGVGGLKRTCLVIFLFGTARQLRMFELEMPTAAAQKPKVRRPSLWSSLSSSGNDRKDSDAETAYEAPLRSRNATKKDSMATISVKPSAEKLVVDGEKVVMPTLSQNPPRMAKLSLSDPEALANVVNVLSLTPSAASGQGSEKERDSPTLETCIKMEFDASEDIDVLPEARARGLTCSTTASPDATFTNPWDNMSVAGSSNVSRMARSS